MNYPASLITRPAPLLFAALILSPAWSSEPNPPLRAALREIVVAQDSGLASSVAEWKSSRRTVARLLTKSRVPRHEISKLAAMIRRSVQGDPALTRLWESARKAPRHARPAIVDNSLPLIEAHLRARFPTTLSALESAALEAYQLDL